jgi:hypothetical protein
VLLYLSLSFSIWVSLQHSTVGIASVLFIRNLVCFGTLEGLIM